MIKVGNKVRKIRELKGITAKAMAHRLDLTIQGYNRIERDEVDVNMERLKEIAGILEMMPEEIMNFDEKLVFNNNNYGGTNYNNNHPTGANHFYSFPEEMKKLYEDNIRLQEEKNKLQAEMIEMLKERLKIAEAK